MNFPSSRCFWVLAVFAGLHGLIVRPVNAQAFYLVSKGQNYFQTSAAAPVVHPSQAYTVSVQAATAVTLVLPDGSPLVMPFLPLDGYYGTDQTFASKSALDAAFPVGSYRMTGAAIPTLSLNLGSDSYPAVAPQVTNGTWNAGGIFVVNPAQATTITFSAFSGYTTGGVAGHVRATVKGTSDNVRLQSEVATQSVFGISAQAAPITSITIPAGTLTSGRIYEGQINFDTLTTLDATTVSGGGVVAIFNKGLQFYLGAQSAGTTTPAPVIFQQPANQAGVVGGSVNLNFGVSVGGANQPNNLIVLWSFNGRQINLDGTKYANNANGGGLTIRTLTVADAGDYTVTVINAGGIVTSLAARVTVAASAPPTITQQPTNQQISNNSTVVFSVVAPTATSYQWRKNGSAIPGASVASLVIFGATAADAGSYSVVATNAAGTTASIPASLNIAAGFDFGRLINLSILSDISASAPNYIMGTVIGGAAATGTKPILIRAVGPSLNQIIGTGALADSKVELFSASGSIASNDDWAGTAALVNAFDQVGAFRFIGPASKDAAIFTTLDPGGYTVLVSGGPGATGRVISEVYDATSVISFRPQTPRLINVSVRKQIDAGASLTAGFVIGGSTARTVLVRAIGPGLGVFGVPGVMADPKLELFSGSNSIAINDNWGGDPQLTLAGARVGAFAIANQQSGDAMILITLQPGQYSAQVSGVTGGGTALVEVYDVP